MSAITCRDDLSFTTRDDCGRMTNWPQNNPGVAGDFARGTACFDEVAMLAGADETDAFHAIKSAMIDMGGRTTNLELGFVESVARAAVLGLRAMRNGASRFEPLAEG